MAVKKSDFSLVSDVFHRVFCCPVLQGYGLTETSAATTLQLINDVGHGHVGPPLSCSGMQFQ